MSQASIDELLEEIPGWHQLGRENALQREFRFMGYRETIRFVNKVADIAEQQDHHPEMHVSYNRCKVTYTTHLCGGISENDFICASQINSLVD